VFTTNSGQTHPIPITSGVPQDSSLGPAQFISYTEYTTDIFSLHSVQYHMFADDTQSYSHSAICEIPALVHQSYCHVSTTSPNPMLPYDFNSTRRKPSSWFGSRVNLTGVPQCFRSIQVCGSVIECDVVAGPDLGVGQGARAPGLPPTEGLPPYPSYFICRSC